MIPKPLDPIEGKIPVSSRDPVVGAELDIIEYELNLWPFNCKKRICF